jgi:hypothetical protein
MTTLLLSIALILPGPVAGLGATLAQEMPRPQDSSLASEAAALDSTLEQLRVGVAGSPGVDTAQSRSDVWGVADRALTLLITAIALIAVVLAHLTWKVTREEREARERAHAASVINVADLIARRIEGVWKNDFGYALDWPSLDALDRWLQEIEQDISFAGTMQDRAASVDLKTVAHAEYVWLRFFEMRNALVRARVTCHNNVEGRELVPPHVQQLWKKVYRRPLLVKCEEAAEALRRLEAVFPPEASSVDGRPRAEHMRMLAEEIAAVAAPKAVEHGDAVERRVTEAEMPSY